VAKTDGETVLGKISIRGVPVFFDGMLVGTLLATGLAAFVLTFAISIEQMFVGLAVAATFIRLGKSGMKLFLLTMLFAGIFASGMLLGALVVSGMSELVLDRAIGMATAIMLFVVVEEMMRDAHEQGRSEPLSVRLAFFGGFLLTLIIG
jgi:ZIP family zinc transporter